MEGDHPRAVDLGGGAGFPHSLRLGPSPRYMPTTFPPTTRATISHDKGNPADAGERGHPRGHKTTVRVHKQHLFSPPKRWGLAAHNKSQGPQSVCNKAALQNGGHQDPEGHHLSQGLHGQNRPKRCILLCTGGRERQEIPQVRVEQENLRVHMPTIWACKCSLDLYKAAQASPNIPETTRNPLPYVSGQYAPVGQNSRGTEGDFRPLSETYQLTRLHHQLEKTTQEPTQRIEFLGFIIDSIKMTLSISRVKQNNLISECKKLLTDPLTTVRNLSHVIGLMMSMSLAVLPALYITGTYSFRKTRLWPATSHTSLRFI